MTHSKKTRTAFTLVELLVVIVIISMLIGMLLPAVNAAREHARFIKCANNVKQIGLAVQGYLAQTEKFPPNWGQDTEYGGSTVKGKSWLVAIMPYMELKNLYEKIDQKQAMGYTDSTLGVDNTWAAQQPIASFRCASDFSTSTLTSQLLFASGTSSGTYTATGITNYKACSGANWNGSVAATQYCKQNDTPKLYGLNSNTTDGRDFGDGIICRNYRGVGGTVNAERVFRPADIVDGSSTTFLMGEAVPEYCPWSAWYWFQGTTATCGIPINWPAARTRPTNLSSFWKESCGFASRHPTSANFGMCDGSTRTISYMIDIRLYRAMATIDGREVINPE